MADVLTADGLVLYINDGTNTYPFACAKSTTITITKEFLELAPKTNNVYKEYIPARASFTMNGSGLVKIIQTGKHPITFFDTFIEGTSTLFAGRFDMIDPQGNYKKYSFNCYIQSLTLESTYGSTPSYSYALQGVGGFTEVP